MLRGLRSIRLAAEQEAAACRRHVGTGPAERQRPAIRPALSGRLANLCRRGRDITVVFGDSDVNRAFRGVKLGARLKQIERRPDCLRARGASGLLIVSTSQPMSKLSAANGPGLAMAVDREIGEGGAVGVVKQRCGRAGKGKGKGHRYGALLS